MVKSLFHHLYLQCENGSMGWLEFDCRMEVVICPGWCQHSEVVDAVIVCKCCYGVGRYGDTWE